jgi:Cu+-exporting ATPase
VAALVARVGKAGYAVKPARADFDVTGMTCASCAASIERVLGKTPGVLAARVNLAAEKAQVDYLPGTIDPAGIAARIGKAGFAASEVHQAGADGLAAREAAERTAWRRQLAMFALSAALSLPLLAQMAMMFGAAATPVCTPNCRAGCNGRWPRRCSCGSPRLLRGRLEIAAQRQRQHGRAGGVGHRHRMAVQHRGHGGRAAWPARVFRGQRVDRHLGAARPPARIARQAPHSRAVRALLGPSPPRQSGARRAGGRSGRGQPRSRRRVRGAAGERVPVDGQVVGGRADVDEAMLSGEAMPVAKAPGDAVYAATINRDGLLRARATGVGADTLLAQIVRMVDAQGSKAPIQALADRIAAVFVPAVLAIAVLTFGSRGRWPAALPPRWCMRWRCW